MEKITPEVRAIIADINRWVVSNPITVNIRSMSSLIAGGERKSRSRGPDGFDIAVTTEYDPDIHEPREVDFVASAAEDGAQTLLVTQYFEPRDHKFFVLVDTNITMDFGTQRTLKRYLGAELAASIIQSVSETADRVGVIVYSDKDLEWFQRPRGANGMVGPAIHKVVTANSVYARAQGKPKVATKPGFANMTGFQKALRSLNGYSRSPVYIISDFLNLTAGDKAALNKVGVQHQVTCLVVQDERERELPRGEGFLWNLFGWGGRYHLYDMRTGVKRSIWLNVKNRRQYADAFEKHRQLLFKLFKKCQCAWDEFSTEEGLAAHPKLIRLLTSNRR